MRVAIPVVVMVFLPARRELLQELVEVVLKRRVVVLLDQHCRRGVGDEDVANPARRARRSDGFLDERRHVSKLHPRPRLDLKRV